jgi:glyoxylase-like metal-dependent hydrolase (beta-lactamase superfamily II)
MEFGGLELTLLSDGVVYVDAGGPFGLVPRALYEERFPPDGHNRIPMTLNCLLIRSEERTILVDTGLGTRLSDNEARRWGLRRPRGGLVESLRSAGVSPEEVDTVINTHLHSDHCSGNTRFEGDVIVPTYPNAEYVVQRVEWAAFRNPDPRTRGTYFAENFQPILEGGKAHLLHGDTQISEHVKCVVTPGHTRGHQSVVIHSGDWYGMFVGDLASYAVHMDRLSWMTAYDAEPLETIETKKLWRKWAVERKAWLFFQHDPLVPVARYVEGDGRPTLQPVEEASGLTAMLPTPRPIPE